MWRPLLSPLRLPVPPSRRFMEGLDSNPVSRLIHISAQGTSVKPYNRAEVFDGFHSFWFQLGSLPDAEDAAVRGRPYSREARSRRTRLRIRIRLRPMPMIPALRS